MVYVRHDPGIKQRALQLHDRGHSADDVAAMMGASTRSICRWDDNYNTFGSVLRPKGRNGRPRAINSDIEDALSEFYRLRTSAYLDEVKHYLAVVHDLRVSLSMIHSTLIRMDLSRKILLTPAAERDEERRRNWRVEMAEHFTAEQLVFGDEVGVDTRDLRRDYGRSLVGHRAVQRYVQKRGQRWSMISVIGLDGCIAARPVARSNSLEFFDFVVSEVLPHMNPYPQPKSVLILDNCAIHKAPAIQQAIEAIGCVLKFLPPYSPDLNPIEESYSALKGYLAHHGHGYMRDGLTAADILEAYVTVATPENCVGWYNHSGY